MDGDVSAAALAAQKVATDEADRSAASGRSGEVRITSRPLDVLVVEDDPGVAQCLREILCQAGHVPTTVSSLRDARMHLAVAHPDVVTLDLQLGNERGVSLLQDLEGLRDRPACVLVSAYRFARSIADDFGVRLVPKPFAIDVLLAAIEDAAESRMRHEPDLGRAGESPMLCEPSQLPPPFVAAPSTSGSGEYRFAVRRRSRT